MEKLQEIFDLRFNDLPENKSFARCIKQEEKQYSRFHTGKYQYDCKNEFLDIEGNSIGFLFSFSEEQVTDILNIIGKKTIVRELNGKCLYLIGLITKSNTILPPHLDSLDVRRHYAWNYMLSGIDSSTIFYKEETGEETLKLNGIHSYHFNPCSIVHSARTKNEPIKLIQFFYDRRD